MQEHISFSWLCYTEIPWYQSLVLSILLYRANHIEWGRDEMGILQPRQRTEWNTVPVSGQWELERMSNHWSVVPLVLWYLSEYSMAYCRALLSWISTQAASGPLHRGVPAPSYGQWSLSNSFNVIYHWYRISHVIICPWNLMISRVLMFEWGYVTHVLINQISK